MFLPGKGSDLETDEQRASERGGACPKIAVTRQRASIFARRSGGVPLGACLIFAIAVSVSAGNADGPPLPGPGEPDSANPALGAADASTGQNNAVLPDVPAGVVAMPVIGGGAPIFGNAVRLGPGGNLFGQALPGSPTQAPSGLEIVPGLTISEQATAGGFSDSGIPDNDFITNITPSIGITQNTADRRISLFYQPSGVLYARRSYDDAINQNLNGEAILVLSPNELALTAHAYVTEQATAGGRVPGGTSVLLKSQRTTSQSYDIGPSFQHALPGVGTLTLSYLASYSSQSGNVAVAGPSGFPYFQPNDVFDQAESGIFTTVPIFPRFDYQIALNAGQDRGTGLMDGAHRLFIDNTVRYAFIRHGYLELSGGYESLYYTSLPPTDIQDATWSVGVDMKPRARSELVVQYRHRYGFNAPYLRMTIPVTARTVLAASYSKTLNTQLGSLQESVANSTVNQFGMAVSSVGQFPVLLTNQALAVQDSLFRETDASIWMTTTWPRDSLSFGVSRTQQDLVASAPGGTGFSQTATTGSVAYSHLLTPALTLAAFGDYGRTNALTLGGDTTATYAFDVSVSDQLTRRLTASVQFEVTNQSGIVGITYGTGTAGSGAQGSIIVALQTTFQ